MGRRPGVMGGESSFAVTKKKQKLAARYTWAAGPLDSAQGRLARASVPTWSFLLAAFAALRAGGTALSIPLPLGRIVDACVRIQSMGNQNPYPFDSAQGRLAGAPVPTWSFFGSQLRAKCRVWFPASRKGGETWAPPAFRIKAHHHFRRRCQASR
jgi:hypothetical protein